MPRNKETTSRRLSYGTVFFNLFLPSLGAAFYRLIIPRGTRVQRTTGKSVTVRLKHTPLFLSETDGESLQPCKKRTRYSADRFR